MWGKWAKGPDQGEWASLIESTRRSPRCGKSMPSNKIRDGGRVMARPVATQHVIPVRMSPDVIEVSIGDRLTSSTETGCRS